MPALGKKMGRPTKAAEPGKRSSLGLKVTAETKTRLDQAARANGRTQSQEAEYRLERSFAEEAAFSSPQMRFWAYSMAQRFTGAGKFEAKMRDADAEWSDADWMADPLIYQSAMFSVIDKLLREMPRPNRDDVRLYLVTLAGQLQALEQELLRTNTLVSDSVKKDIDDAR